jgi:acetate kinase
MRVLVLNAGSSSLKGALVEPAGRTVARAEVVWGADASRTDDRAGDLADLIARLIAEAGDGAPIDAVGHRVVHGGSRFTTPVRIDSDVLSGIRAMQDVAPLHNGVALDAIASAMAALPDVPHVACFDTAFHVTLEPAAWRYPLPDAWTHDWGVRRYGFHGLSVAWSCARTAELLGRPVERLGLVVAHLGSGCSVTAVDGGRSVDTSMGWTPLEGLMMGTRAGSIDPGILVRLLADGRLSVPDLVETLDHGAGLLAVAGSADLRTVLDLADAGDERAALGLAMFVRRAAAGIGASATALGRWDALVFTGGIGEGSARVREAIADRLGALGVTGPLADAAGDDAVLTPADAPVAIVRVAAREDLVIASLTATVIGS